ncbi:U-scoloptoxin(01)-Cw1a-like [Ornithodoros turicata]|uniref:U-scoloptoxin(01)-Cw1a-like n=1 Tax=Ornithodoros turicata TaxID=34597 RepID=UPI0031386C9E
MKVLIVLAAVAVAFALPRAKRAAYELPDGVEFIVGSVKTSFQCPARNGYFADVDNNCLLFHVCNVATHPDGNTEVQQYSFFCGNQTVFNQATLTCAHPEESVPCASSQDFFYVNDNLGVENAPFLTDNDLQRAYSLYPGRAAAKA